MINDQGIHPGQDKLGCIHEWHTPCNYNDVQQFVGLVNYIATFLPDIMAYTGLLIAIIKNGAPFIDPDKLYTLTTFLTDNHHVDDEIEAVEYINTFVRNSEAFTMYVGDDEVEQDCFPIKGSNSLHMFR